MNIGSLRLTTKRMLLVVLVGATGAAFAMLARAGVAEQKQFAFNHKVHIKADVDCLQCHEGLLDATASPLPEVGTCAKCHNDDPGTNVNKKALAAIIAAKTPLVWMPAVGLPNHVYFSHSRHVDVASLECKVCHATIAEATAPPARAHTLSMKECIACHETHPDKKGAMRATIDCASCHR